MTLTADYELEDALQAARKEERGRVLDELTDKIERGNTHDMAMSHFAKLCGNMDTEWQMFFLGWLKGRMSVVEELR